MTNKNRQAPHANQLENNLILYLLLSSYMER